MSTENSFTIINQTGENILVAFISRMTQLETYAWKVVGPSQDHPHIEPFPKQMELVTNYYSQGVPSKDPYGGKQTDSVWWDTIKRVPTAYKADWNEAANKVDVKLEGENHNGADISIENNSGSMIYVHPKFGSNEYIPPIPLIAFSTASYKFEWPMSVAVVDGYSQYCPPNGELYEVKNKLSDLSEMLPGQTVIVTGNLSEGYQLKVS